ncbi:hypothetical protein GQ457_HM000580 [Hibiscus cannabinus]
MLAFVNFFLGGDGKRTDIPQRFPMAIIFGGDGIYMAPFSLQNDANILASLLSKASLSTLCRVFCANCTTNLIFVPSDEPSAGREDSERIRDLASTKSSCTCNSSSSIVGSTPYAAEPYYCVNYNSGLSHRESAHMNGAEQNSETSGMSTDQNSALANSSSNNFGFSGNSDDEDDDYGAYRSDSESKHYVHAEDIMVQSIMMNMTLIMDQINNKTDQENADEGEAQAPAYDVDGTSVVPVDFESNRLLWLPPEPADEEDEKEAALLMMTMMRVLRRILAGEEEWILRGYVKVKCIAAGRRHESAVVKGVVCKKNVAHRRMTSNNSKPRFLILGGALEYQRISNHLSSFDTLWQLLKLAPHHPNVLLVEKSVSRYAQDYLLANDISLVLNIKRPL